MPENPEFAGVVENQYIAAQFCICSPSFEFCSMDLREEAITPGGKPAVLFRGTGAFHVYGSHMSSIIGVWAYFAQGGGSIVVIVEVQSSEAYGVARHILLSMHPQPNNTGMPL